MTQEQWRVIDGFPSYEVSDFGRVRSLSRVLQISESGNGRNLRYSRHRTGRILKTQQHSNGYLSVRLCPGNKTALVNRLVCSAFHGPPPAADSQADHINSVRSDARAENLRWLSPQDNRERRATAVGERNGQAKLNATQVQDIYLRSRSAHTDTALAIEAGVCRATIRNIRCGHLWSHITNRIRQGAPNE